MPVIDISLLTVSLITAYLDRLTMPKMIINSGGDEFFMPNDNHYFWDDLPDDKYFRYGKVCMLLAWV